jgi:hypothetical protein
MPMDVGFLPPTGNNGLTGQMPVGSITAFTNHLTGTPSLPSNWIECDGSVIQDPKSPMNGQTLPDLNGGARFLRGSDISGTLQAADTVVPAHAHSMNNHTHDLGGHTHGPGSFSPTGGVGNTAGSIANTLSRTGTTVIAGWTLQGTSGAAVGNTLGPSTANTASDGGSGSETRPINMSVIWIMRIW